MKAGGYQVHTAADGSEALKLAAEHSLDLMLLDIGLPGPDGLAVLEAVRRDMQVPVLMISARGREADRVKALDLGADDYLTKPFGVAELLARVRALLRRSASGAVGPPPPDLCTYRGGRRLLDAPFRGAKSSRRGGLKTPGLQRHDRARSC